MTKFKYAPLTILLLLALVGSLGCSVGTLLVRAPTPTMQPTKTPRPTFTFTPDWTPTLMPTFTATFTPIAPTDTPTPVEPTVTNTPEGPTETPVPPTNTPGPPPPPADTPTPEPPTATATPPYTPFQITPYIYDTGSPIQTRITAAVIDVQNAAIGDFDGMLGYQLKVIDPLGGEHLTDPIEVTTVVGSTGPGLGDNHLMNIEMKITPYMAGHYKAWLEKNGQQESAPVEFDMGSSPPQYVHIDFFLYH